MDIQQLEYFFSDFQIYRLRPGNIIKLVRHTLGLSSREFAKRTGLSQTDVTRYELGQKPIPEKKMWIFLEKLNSICPGEFYSSYAITRASRKDSYGNPARRPAKNENFKLDLSTCLKESIFRENYVKLILSGNLYSDYIGNSFHGTDVLRKLLWRILLEVIYTYGENSSFYNNKKFISILAYLLNIIDQKHLFDDSFIADNIIPKTQDILKGFYHHLEHPNIPAKVLDTFYTDFFMLIFNSLNMDFEERIVSASPFEDMHPLQKVNLYWGSKISTTEPASNYRMH